MRRQRDRQNSHLATKLQELLLEIREIQEQDDRERLTHGEVVADRPPSIRWLSFITKTRRR